MRLKSIAMLAGAFLLTGCYHIQVISGRTPSATLVERPWQHSFVAGLVPPPELNVKDQCTNGVAKVETLMSPANVGASLLVSVVTLGFGGWIWTPLSAKVTCASR
jgi:hypothetical protein